jgi:error-prone DNA polymerase
LVAGLRAAAAERIVRARAEAPFTDVQDLARRARLDAQDLRQLAAADALRSLAGHRRQQVWEATAWTPPPALLEGASIDEPPLQLPLAAEGEEIVFDYAALGLTLRRHPLALLREQLRRRRLQTAHEMHDLPHGRRVRACGIVTGRQQPQTANGTIFVSLEDESGVVNVIVWRHVQERFRRELLHARLLAVQGEWQREGEVRHLVAQRLEDLTPLLGRLADAGLHSRDFH